MDKMCKKLATENLSKAHSNSGEIENVKRCESPVFKCINQTKPVRGSHLNISDRPDFQKNQSVKNRTTSKHGNETSESVLPLSPVFSPISVPSTSQFQPPIHSLRTVAKNLGQSRQNKVNSFTSSGKIDVLKPHGIFESLGMSDKDISWVSSMASPPPKCIPGSEFNTLEKATFFPEEKFQNIQPRALFSPTFDDDFGCQPITFHSECDDDDDDDDDEAYKSNIRLSDVCDTLKQLEVKSLGPASGSSGEKIISNENCLILPVIRLKMEKSENIPNKKKNILAISPENKDKYEFPMAENLKTVDYGEVKSNDGNNFIEDDSFQSLSFSCLDELCKNLGTEHCYSSRSSKSDYCDKTLIANINCNSKPNILKKFYFSKTTTNIYAVSSMDNLHSYAKALEEGDKCTPGGKKIDLPNKGIVRFDLLNKDPFKTDATKRLHSEVTEEKDEYSEKKFKNVSDEDSGWEKVKQYLSESQLNVSDDEIFRTVENAEKTLPIQEKKQMQNLNLPDEEAILSQSFDMLEASTEISVKNQAVADIMNSESDFNLLKICKLKSCDTKDSCQNLLTMPLRAFTTASGSKISVSEKALFKAREILKGCDDENLENADGKGLMDYSSIQIDKLLQISKKSSESCCGTEKMFLKESFIGSGKQIKISVEDQEELHPHVASDETFENSIKQIQDSRKKGSEGKFWKNLMGRCSTDSEKVIQTSAKSLEKSQSFKADYDENIKKLFGVSADFLKSSSSDQTLEKPEKKDQILKADFGEKLGMKGFMTGSGKPIPVSTQSLENIKAFLSKCDEESEKNPSQFIATFMEELRNHRQNQTVKLSVKPTVAAYDEKPEPNLTISNGFSTGSGKIIQISADALKKANNFMQNCEKQLNESFDELASNWIKDLTKQCFNICVKDRREANGSNEKLPKREQDSMTVFSNALGNKVNISNIALKKAKASWSKSDESIPKMPKSLAKALPQVEPFLSFTTSKRPEVKISETALAKAEECVPVSNPNEFENTGNSCCVVDGLKTPVKSAIQMKAETANAEGNSGKLSTASGIDLSDDWDEIIPSWLHVYNTSPSVVSDRTEFSPIVTQENGKSLNAEREYIVRSPVLGLGDRFYGKKKRRKLQFEEQKKSMDKNQRGFVAPYKNAELKTSMKRTSTLSLDFSAPFKKLKFVEDLQTIDLNVTERVRAREEQEKIIKTKLKVKPVKGSHLSKKYSEKQMNWIEAVNGSSPEAYSDDFLRSFGISEDILQINIENAAFFKFKGEDFLGSRSQRNVNGIPAGDGCFLIFNNENKFGIEEFRRAFLASPGVQPNLVPDGWVENHYKWIIWKLAHYERSFPQYFGKNGLTPNNVMLQLKYRYDREIDRNERSTLKKVLERDDTSVKRMVLCVCGIKKIGEGETRRYELNLTDGWYSCPARSDSAMTRLIEKGKLSIGTKLLTQGASIVNCEQGVSPLEISEDVYLKISTNSTRRIRWDAKLGFQKKPENFPISLSSILPQGGSISRIDVIVVRIYPTLFMEKTLDGHHVTRNRRSEEKADAEYRKIQDQRIESIYNEIQSEMRALARLKKKLNKNNLNELEQAEDLCQLMEAGSDLSVFKFQDLMSTGQNQLLEKFHSNQTDSFSREIAKKIEKKLEKEKLNKRNVSEFLRAKVVDFRKPDYNNPAVLSVWNPNEDLIALLSEGKVFSVLNVTTSNSSRLYKPMQISTTRQTQFRHIVKNVKYPTRKLTQLKSVSSKICPAFEEVDLVGMVSFIQDVSYGSRLSQVVYLTDLEMNFVGVVFWGSCKDFGWENVLRIPSVVACSNLQWKKNYSNLDVPSLYVNENSVFTENPKHSYLKEEIERLKKNMPQDMTAFLCRCEEDLTTKLEDSKWRTNTTRNASNDSTLRATDYPARFRNIIDGFECRPTASSTPIKPFNARMGPDEPEPSPIQKRIESLQKYGEPPPLIPLLARNNTKRKFKKKC